ncbi:VOC family protein [Isoptericola sp. NEAU-Y5]|uniref:VOC family protein n=1 Tax=Isoptericola luteus TaxID=2879484 RepID=A0ABS7ZK76_9MICO|nr:VOC family protein [Isoptericola sp. NEAU-Y5]MCA5894185.1 VOC family protein [Isoptericola sp. NEAU-Y5]
MTSRISHTTFDARDAYAQSVFWADVLGYTDVPGDPNLPGHVECMIVPRTDVDARPESRGRVLFIEVPEAKEIKNRVHLDLRPTDRTRDEEVERLLALGATQVADRRRPDGGWVVLADPEGNEFCILRSDAEVESSGAS